MDTNHGWNHIDLGGGCKGIEYSAEWTKRTAVITNGEDPTLPLCGAESFVVGFYVDGDPFTADDKTWTETYSSMVEAKFQGEMFVADGDNGRLT